MDTLTAPLRSVGSCSEATLAPRPRRLEDTGLSQTFLADLLNKHLLLGGVLSLNQISERLCLPSRIVQDLLHFLRQEERIEVMATDSVTGTVRYGLTNRGRIQAGSAFAVSGYAGPAPVPLALYVATVAAQTVHGIAVTREQLHGAFHDVVISADLLDDLGPSLNSGRAIFIYGPPGTGKTYLSQRIARVFTSAVLIPHAIAIGEAVISVFDPVSHKTVERADRGSLSVEGAADERFVLCHRPALVVGGELTADMLEIQFDEHTRQYTAPLQLRANNGIFIIDDLGRQRVEPQTVFNRWTVPLEEKRDFLNLGSGRQFSVPFDVVLVFSTNKRPSELADEAFLRRVGYKIRFSDLDADQYERIWRDQCRANDLPFDEEVLDYAIHHLHRATGVPLLPCHPRDLLGLCVDRAAYTGLPRRVTRGVLDWAWKNYFARSDENDEPTPQLGVSL
jgi:hypothetical protein